MITVKNMRKIVNEALYDYELNTKQRKRERKWKGRDILELKKSAFEILWKENFTLGEIGIIFGHSVSHISKTIKNDFRDKRVIPEPMPNSNGRLRDKITKRLL